MIEQINSLLKICTNQCIWLTAEDIQICAHAHSLLVGVGAFLGRGDGSLAWPKAEQFQGKVLLRIVLPDAGGVKVSREVVPGAEGLLPDVLHDVLAAPQL